MTVREELDALRSDYPACRLAAFADLKAKMVLMTSPAQSHPQEMLQRLSQRGADLFAIAKQDTDDLVIAWENDQMNIFLRSPKEPADMLCCQVHPEAELGGFLETARASLSRISSGE
jgi:hypothetical protein